MKAIDLVGNECTWACIARNLGCTCRLAERQQAAREIDERVEALEGALRDVRYLAAEEAEGLAGYGYYMADDQPQDDATERLSAACLYLGDLLRLCSALGVEVPAGTVPSFTRDSDAGWGLHVPGHYHLFDIDDDDDDLGVTHVVEALAVGMTAQQALDAIVKEVCGV